MGKKRIKDFSSRSFRSRRSVHVKRGTRILLFGLAVVLALAVGVWKGGWLPQDLFPGDLSPVPSSDLLSQPTDGSLEVYFFDVGQGDSQLVRFTDASGTFHMLIDTGEREYANGLLQALRALGVDRLDALVMSHPHSDHMGGMGEILEQMPVDRLYMPVVPEEYAPTTVSYEHVLDAASETGLPVIRLVRGSQVETPASLTVQVLSPEEDADWEELNNFSAVLRVSYGETSFLLTGDAEGEAEAQILEHVSDLHAQVLKCGHHGSSTSTTASFLCAVAPDYAVISCGADNPYGHPHSETLARLLDAGVQVLRTDEDRTLLFSTDGKQLTVIQGLPSMEGGP